MQLATATVIILCDCLVLMVSMTQLVPLLNLIDVAIVNCVKIYIVASYGAV